jgi:hypothetical protein
MLPPDWQEQLAAVIRGAAEPDLSWFACGLTLSPQEQVGVYQEQYRLRLWDALVEEVPGLRWLLGDRAQEVLWAYLDACPPRSWTLNRVADRLAGWLRDAGHPQAWVDMAVLDAAVAASFDAADGRPLTPEALTLDLSLTPHVRLLELRHTVHLVRSAALERREVPALEARDLRLVVFRRGHGVRHAEAEDGAWALLRAIEAGTPLVEALGGLEPEDGAKVAGWFQGFAEAGWVGPRG